VTIEGRYQAWHGREWQDYCLMLLRARYIDHRLQEVPDRHKGDLGLEAFTHDGIAFQCYAATEPLDVKSLYEAQRDKLTADLTKLKKKKAELAKLLNGVVIETYVFMVPRHESKDLVIHAQTKAAEVRSWDLPFISDNFAITIETDEHYAAERNAVCSVPAQLIDDGMIEPAVLEDWRGANAPLLSDAHRKLTALGLEGQALSAYLDRLLTEHLRGENMLSSLRAKYPDSWYSVAQVQSEKENLLAVEYPPGSAGCAGDVKAIADELMTEIIKAAPPVPHLSARLLAWAFVAGWILHCPLDFEVVR
jgi:hypothetical protein